MSGNESNAAGSSGSGGNITATGIGTGSTANSIVPNKATSKNTTAAGCGANNSNSANVAASVLALAANNLTMPAAKINAKLAHLSSGTSAASGISAGNSIHIAAPIVNSHMLEHSINKINNNNTTTSTTNTTTTSGATTNVIKVAVTLGSGVISNGLSSGTVNTAITTTSTTTTTIRALSASGQSTQVRVVMPPGLMPSTMFKQLESSANAAGLACSAAVNVNNTGTRTAQITALPAAAAAAAAAHTRTLTNTAISVARPLTQTTYLPRTSLTGTHMTAVGQRLLTPIRTTPASTGNTIASGFVRSPNAIARNTNSPAGSGTLTPANNTTWMTTSTSGQVQLIRAISQQTRRLINSAGLPIVTASNCNATNVSSTASAHIQSSNSGNSGGNQSTYVATLATVLPPRPHQATLVYSSNSTPVPSLTPTVAAVQHNFSVSSATGARIAVATPLTGAGGSANAAARHIRPISLGKPFTTNKLNTTSISLRTPTMPQLAPTLTSVSSAMAAAVGNSTRSSISAPGGSNISTTNLSTTRIIQLQQQQPGSAGNSQLLSSTGRLTGNVMLQPIIVNSAGKIAGFRPPVTMSAKGQPSLTITHVASGKITSVSSGGSTLTTASNANNINSTNSASVTATAAHLLGSTVVPVAIAARSASMAIAGSGSIYASNLTPKSLNKAFMCAATPTSNNSNNAEHHSLTADHKSGSIYLHNATLTLSSMAQRAPITVVAGLTTNAATTVSATIVTTALTTTTAPTATTAAAAGAASATTTVSGCDDRSNEIITTAAITTATLTKLNAIKTFKTATTTTTVTTTSTATSAATITNAISTITTTTTIANNTATTTTSTTLIFYESTPATSSGVLSINPTITAQQHHHHQQQQQQQQQQKPATYSVVTANTNTVNNTSNIRAIAQLHLPAVSSTATGLPMRLATAHLNNNNTTAITTINNAVTVNDKCVIATTTSNILQQQQQQPQQQQPTLHTIIPLQTAGLKMSSATTTVVTNFLRKRDADGAFIGRAAKNLAPTLIAMSSNSNNNCKINNHDASSINNSVTSASNYCGTSVNISGNCSSTAHPMTSLTIDALTKNDCTVNNHRSDSPVSSEGSTTVSANSSPGVDQMEDVLAMYRNAMHFNPIHELYRNYQHNSNNGSNSNSSNSTQSSASSINSRNLESQHHHQHQHQHLNNHQHNHHVPPRLNGENRSGYTLRKKPRPSISEPFASRPSGFTLTTPIVGCINNRPTDFGITTDIAMGAGNGNNAYCSSSSSSNSNSLYNGCGSDMESLRKAPIYNKENKQPIDYVLRKTHKIAMWDNNKYNTKLSYNHFLKPTDVKPREERKPSLFDLANDPSTYESVSGWKVLMVKSQLEDLRVGELENYTRFTEILKDMESTEEEDDGADFERLRDLIKGNMQRVQIIRDGIQEAENQMLHLLDHKPHVTGILQRCQSKRNCRKRNKT